MEDLHERLRLIASAQECMVQVADIMDQWDRTQLAVEKSTFDAINISDKVLNLSKEENGLLSELKESYSLIEDKLETEQKDKIKSLYIQISELMQKIIDISYASNEISHILEREVASQREFTDSLKSSFGQINKSIDQAVACAEFMMTDL